MAEDTDIPDVRILESLGIVIGKFSISSHKKYRVMFYLMTETEPRHITGWYVEYIAHSRLPKRVHELFWESKLIIIK